MPKVSFSLDAASAGEAANQLRAYADAFTKKCELLRTRVAEHIRWSAENGFRTAQGSGLQQDGDAEIKVYAEHRDHVSVVFVQGAAAIRLEYGPGASSTRTINDETMRLDDTAVTMPMYRGVQDALAVFGELMREVFS